MTDRKLTTTAAPVQTHGDYEVVPSALMTGVIVPTAQNALGAFGVFLFTLTLNVLAGKLMTNKPFEAIDAMLWVAGGVAMLVFSAAMAVRFFRDEVRVLLGLWAELRNRQEMAALKVQVDELNKQNTDLRRRSDVSDRYGVQSAAERMLADYFERNQKISRSACMSRGMTRPDWEAAAGALRDAGVLNERGDVVAADYATAWAAVLKHFSTSRNYVRTADGDFAQV